MRGLVFIILLLKMMSVLSPPTVYIGCKIIDTTTCLTCNSTVARTLTQIVTDSITYANYQPSMRLNSKQRTHRYLKNDVSGGVNSNYLLQNFANTATNLDALANIENALSTGSVAVAQGLNASFTAQNNNEQNAQLFYNLYSQSKTTGLVTIANNNLDKVFNGITTSNWKHQRIIDNSNTITLINDPSTYTSINPFGTFPVPQYGIIHQNNSIDNVIGNKVTGFGLTKLPVYGIASYAGMGQNVWCNSTYDTYRGFSFGGAQNLTNWRKNNMRGNMFGFELNNTTIGQQGSPTSPIGNQWLAGWGGRFKTFVQNLDPATVVAGNNSVLYMTTGTIPAPVFNGFNISTARYKTTSPQSLFPASGPIGVFCNAPLVTPDPSTGGANINIASSFESNFVNIVSNGYAYGSQLNGNRKNGKIATYQALLQDSALSVIANPTLQNFKTNNANTAIGKLVQTETELANNNLTMAQCLANSITPTDTVESNTQLFYQLYLKSKQAVLDSVEYATLTTLAYGCPTRDGVVVYQARVLRNSINDGFELYYDNCPAEQASSMRIGGQSNSETESMIIDDNFIVYPNPSRGKIYFTADNMQLTSFTFNVYDVLGKLVLSKHYTDGTGIKELELIAPAGIYMMHLYDANSEVNYKQKIVIEK